MKTLLKFKDQVPPPQEKHFASIKKHQPVNAL
jgi:hypothetical protein